MQGMAWYDWVIVISGWMLIPACWIVKLWRDWRGERER